MNELLKLLGNIAPALASIVAGPAGGMAVSAISKALGVTDTVEAVTKAISVDPEAALKLAQIDLDKIKADYANTADARDMNVKVQEASNAAWLAKNTAYMLDIGIVTATIFLAWFAFMKDVPAANKELVYMALGSLITMCGTVLNFHRGSSQGSKDKMEALKK